MSCEQISNYLIPYLDGRITAEERQRVEAHLETCAACRLRAEEFNGVWNLLDEAPAPQPSLSFDARLRQRVLAEKRPRVWSWLIPSPRLAFSMALLLAMSVWMTRIPADYSSTRAEEEFRMIKNLRVLENYDVLANFEPLSELPPAPQQGQPQDQPLDQQDEPSM